MHVAQSTHPDCEIAETSHHARPGSRAAVLDERTSRHAFRLRVRKEGSGFKARSSRAERAIKHCASGHKSKRRDDAQPFHQQEEGLRKGIVLRRLSDLGPVELLPNGTYNQQQGREVAVVLGKRQQLGDHDGSSWQHRNPHAENLVFTCRAKQRLFDWNACQAMQHVDQRGLGRRLGAVLAVGLEQPILRRSLDPQPGGRQTVSGLLDIGLSHHKIDIVTGLRPAVYPEGIATPQCEENAVGLQG